MPASRSADVGRPGAGLALGAAPPLALASDTLSIATMELGLPMTRTLAEGEDPELGVGRA